MNKLTKRVFLPLIPASVASLGLIINEVCAKENAWNNKPVC